MNIDFGTVFWITGLSGAGKTTIGKALFNKLYDTRKIVLLDGDEMRDVFGNDLGYKREDRLKNAYRYSRLCRLLSCQGIDVVCCTISMFNDIREWNRDNIQSYKEIYVKVKKEILVQRNQKGLYSSDQTKLVGFGLEMEEPRKSDLVLNNDGNISVDEIVDTICKRFNLLS